jgi:hypothetical protein
LREPGTAEGADAKYFTTEYRSLLYIGDLELNNHSIHLLLNLFGDTNRFLIWKKYRPLIWEFSTVWLKPPTCLSHSSAYMMDDVDVNVVSRENELLCGIIGQPGEDRVKEIMGYNASVRELNINAFHPRRQDAIDNVLKIAHAKARKFNDSVAAVRAEKTHLTRPFRRKREEGQVRQMIWDILATELLNKFFGPEHPLTINVLNNLAWVHGESGRLEEAVTLTLVLEKRKQVLGAEHVDTLRTLDRLALRCQQCSRLEEAEGRYTELLGISKRIWGEEDY